MNVASTRFQWVTMAVALLTLVACNREPTKWREEVRLRNGEQGVITQTRKYDWYQEPGRPSIAFNDGAGLYGTIGDTKIVPWSGDFEPLLIERDPDKDEWVLIVTEASRRRSRTVPLGWPPYRAFRMSKDQWHETEMPEFVWGMRSNLMISSWNIQRQNQLIKWDQKMEWHSTDGGSVKTRWSIVRDQKIQAAN